MLIVLMNVCFSVFCQQFHCYKLVVPFKALKLMLFHKIPVPKFLLHFVHLLCGPIFFVVKYSVVFHL